MTVPTIGGTEQEPDAANERRPAGPCQSCAGKIPTNKIMW